jgi:protoheme IX farnesyltransferase
MINYYLITKPGIIMGNLLTVGAGFLLASKGVFYPQLFFATFLGIALVMASSCVFNNYINREVDKKMERTKNRPLVTGAISKESALFFATILGFLGGLVLYVFTNVLTVSIAAIGFFVYVVLYSYWKCHTIYGTAIGSIAGAVPPVVGYCAVSNQFDMGAALLFIALVLWQMPHFFSIALYHFEDYLAAGIPVLPIKRGMVRTKVHMLLYVVAFIVTVGLLTNLYLALVLGLIWLPFCIKGFSMNNNQQWGKTMFRLSLVVITVLSVALPLAQI